MDPDKIIAQAAQGFADAADIVRVQMGRLSVPGCDPEGVRLELTELAVELERQALWLRHEAAELRGRC